MKTVEGGGGCVRIDLKKSMGLVCVCVCVFFFFFVCGHRGVRVIFYLIFFFFLESPLPFRFRTLGPLNLEKKSSSFDGKGRNKPGGWLTNRTSFSVSVLCFKNEFEFQRGFPGLCRFDYYIYLEPPKKKSVIKLKVAGKAQCNATH